MSMPCNPGTKGNQPETIERIYPMNDMTIQKKLVLWTAFNSTIQDMRLKGFAERLCMEYKAGDQGVLLTQADCAKRFGISAMSVWRYTQALIASGEWIITPVVGHATKYVPRYLNEALNDSHSELGEAA
jgi:hypothetical protein